MIAKRCILENVELTDATNSKAHILPMSLGWRYAPKDVLCKTANSNIGDLIDLPLVRGFEPLAALLGISRQKGDPRPIRVIDESGAVLIFEFGEPLKLSEPSFEEHAIDDGHSFSIGARTMKEARQLLGRVKKNYPNINVDALLADAQLAREWPDGYIKSSVHFGPATVFPAVFTGASIYAAALNQPIHPEFVDYVGRFNPEKPELPPGTFYFAREDGWIQSQGDVSHTVAYFGDPDRKQALVYVEIFNSAGVAVLLPYQGRETKIEARSVDVLNGIEGTPEFDTSRILAAKWEATHKFPEPAIQELLRKKLERVVGIGAVRAHAVAEEKVREDLGLNGELPRDGSGMSKLLAGLSEHTKLMWKRPTSTSEDRLSNLRQFTMVCANLRLCVPPSERASFDEHADRCVEDLAGLI